MLGRVDAISADIAALDNRIGQKTGPFADAVARLDEIPGISLASAYVILAEIGTDMTRFPTAGHLASWARLAPGVDRIGRQEERQGLHRPREPLPRRRPGQRRRGAAGRTDTFLGREVPADRPPPRLQPGHRGAVLPGAEDADVGGVRDADVGTRKGPAAGVAAGPWW